MKPLHWRRLATCFAVLTATMCRPVEAQVSVPPPSAAMTIEAFLDRLMIAESGGQVDARNPRSSAVGPFQFIEATFVAVVRRHFAAETVALSPEKILALRTDPLFARRAADAFTRDNAGVLKEAGVEPTFPHLRLAFLLGPAGAIRVLKAPPETRVTALLGPKVAGANPFLFGMTAEGLVARAARDISQSVASTAGVAVAAGTGVAGPATGRRARPAIAVRCNLSLPSCRRWLALAGSTSARARR